MKDLLAIFGYIGLVGVCVALTNYLRLALAVLLILGALGLGWLLWTGRGTPALQDTHTGILSGTAYEGSR